jgi:hypothetical protein
MGVLPQQSQHSMARTCELAAEGTAASSFLLVPFVGACIHVLSASN